MDEQISKPQAARLLGAGYIAGMVVGASLALMPLYLSRFWEVSFPVQVAVSVLGVLLSPCAYVCLFRWSMRKQA